MSGEPLLTWKGRRVRSPGDGPEAAARKVPEAPRPGSLFFVPSPLEGWGLETLLDRLPPDSVVVVFEKDPELVLACQSAWNQHMEGRTSHPRLFHLPLDTEEGVREVFRRLPMSRLRRCEFLPLNGAWLAQGPRYREVFARFEAGLTRWWSNRMTCLYMGPLWIKNLFDNLASPLFQPRQWPDWGDQTVLVCGAGLTLEGALPWALAHRGEVKVIAADTALPVLRAWGLVPDAVVCLEAQHANLRDFSGWRGAPVDLFTDLTSFPPGSRIFGRPPRWFISEFTELTLWDRWPWSAQQIPRLPPLGSVGVAAAWIAWRLSRGQVILAGLDFSYPPGRTHARGAPSLAALAAQTDRLHPMEQGGTWPRPGLHPTPTGWLTSPVMEGYAGVLSDLARPQAHRTLVWEKQGLPLRLGSWPEGAPPTPTPRTSGVESQEDMAFSDSGTEWLTREVALWRTLLEAFARVKANPEEAEWSTLEAHLAQVDYLTFAFPDPEFRRDPAWLIRAQHQVSWILDRVSRPRQT